MNKYKYEIVTKYTLYRIGIDGTILQPVNNDAYPVDHIFNQYGYDTKQEAMEALGDYDYVGGGLVIIESIERKLIL